MPDYQPPSHYLPLKTYCSYHARWAAASYQRSLRSTDTEEQIFWQDDARAAHQEAAIYRTAILHKCDPCDAMKILARPGPHTEASEEA